MMPGQPQPVPDRVMAELKGWQELAETWPLTFNLADPHLRCAACDQSVMRMQDGAGHGYAYHPEQASVCVVAHIRQAHAQARLPGVSFDSEPPGTLSSLLGVPAFPGAICIPLAPLKERARD